jgi:fucose permease
MDSNIKNFNFAEAVSIASTDHTCKYNSVIYVGTSTATSVLKVTTEGGQDVVFTGIVSGSILPVMVTKVWKIGSDVSNMVALASI